MKVIYVMADTFRRDHTGVYGNPPWWEIHTPNLQAFVRIPVKIATHSGGKLPLSSSS